MPRYEWQGPGQFRDGRNDRLIDPGEIVELEAHVGEPHRQMAPMEEAPVESEGSAHAEELADEHWQRAVSAVEAGDADNYLDELERVDDRDSVLAAIEGRREALEG